MKLKKIIKLALQEDIGKGDITTKLTIPKNKRSKAFIISKSEGILCGGFVCYEVFKQLDNEIKFKQLVKDGDYFLSGKVLFEIEGLTSAILTGERTALNFLQHLSGIATLTHKFVEKIKGTKTKILDTRKTTPLLRELEKYAVRCGGGYNHRFGLYDMILIKDNHITSCGGISNALKRVKKVNNIKVEVETKNLQQVKEALNYNIDRIMLDNMKIEEIKDAVNIIKNSGKRIEIEVSGNVNLDNVREIAECGVDFISIGMLTHSPGIIDMSLELV